MAIPIKETPVLTGRDAERGCLTSIVRQSLLCDEVVGKEYVRKSAKKSLSAEK